GIVMKLVKLSFAGLALFASVQTFAAEQTTATPTTQASPSKFVEVPVANTDKAASEVAASEAAPAK
ncbi:hypothetical protein MW728_002823, partial [Acinetobacter baumannii]